MTPVPLFLALAAARAAAAPARVVLPDVAVPERYEIAVVPDAAAMTFSGTVKIDLELRRPTSRIELNAADLKISRASLGAAAGPPTVSYDAARQTATLAFYAHVPAGRHSLEIDYKGKINLHASGLFALDYDVKGGRKRALFTQFENSDARRFVPCWDEPAKKAVFSLAVTAPAGEMAISNTPIA